MGLVTKTDWLTDRPSVAMWLWLWLSQRRSQGNWETSAECLREKWMENLWRPNVCVIITVILKILQLLVVTTSKDPKSVSQSPKYVTTCFLLQSGSKSIWNLCVHLAIRNTVQQRTWRMRYISIYVPIYDRLCGLVVKVPCYRSRGPGFDSQRYQIFWGEVVGLERGPLGLVWIIEELLERTVGAPV
jgi:hypothetical protein